MPSALGETSTTDASSAERLFRISSTWRRPIKPAPATAIATLAIESVRAGACADRACDGRRASIAGGIVELALGNHDREPRDLFGSDRFGKRHPRNFERIGNVVGH